MRLILALMLMLTPWTAAPQTPLSTTEIAADVVVEDRYPQARVELAQGVTGLPGIVYWEPAGHRPLTLDLYLPPAHLPRPVDGFPAIVYIHGDMWRDGDPRRSGAVVDFPGVLASLASQGYVVASVQYRLSGEARFPAQIQDVKAALRWLRMSAWVHGIDPTRMATWGVSAGAHLAALAAVSCGVQELAPRQARDSRALDNRPDPVSSENLSECVQASAAWYGVFDMNTIAQQARDAGALSRDSVSAPEWRLLGCAGAQCTPEQLSAASPVHYVDAEDPPMLLIAGDGDRVVPHAQTVQMALRLQDAGVRHEVVVLPGVGHGFIGSTHEATRDANLTALTRTFDFLRASLKLPERAAGR